MTNKYFVVYLKDSGNILYQVQDFDRQCGLVQGADEYANMILFLTEENGIILAIIPRENILMIKYVES